ncbi:MAG: hypothetical protein RLZZ244_2045 [Verrucomicrobiota bacterium]|jgi:hypothetical protein
MNQEWTIQSRGDCCAASGEPFVDGQFFFTLLFEEGPSFRREDLSVAAFKNRPEDAPKPAYFWRSKYELPPPKPPEALGKQTAEELLRRFMAEASPQHANVRYILALMLERKRVLKEVETRRAHGEVTRIYEHSKSGEVFVIPDPQLRLDQIAEVQLEVGDLLGGALPPPTEPPSPSQGEPAPALPNEG